MKELGVNKQLVHRRIFVASFMKSGGKRRVGRGGGQFTRTKRMFGRKSTLKNQQEVKT